MQGKCQISCSSTAGRLKAVNVSVTLMIQGLVVWYSYYIFLNFGQNITGHLEILESLVLFSIFSGPITFFFLLSCIIHGFSLCVGKSADKAGSLVLIQFTVIEDLRNQKLFIF